jgi:hypothetical protein
MLKNFKKLSKYFIISYFLLFLIVLTGFHNPFGKNFANFIILVHWFLIIPIGIIEEIEVLLSIELKLLNELIQFNSLVGLFLINTIFAFILAFFFSLIYTVYKKLLKAFESSPKKPFSI